jgi:hypothetical protein
MTGENPTDDPRILWQSQRTEHQAMSIEDVRAKADKVQAKVRRNLFVTFALALLLSPLFIQVVLHLPIRGRIIASAVMALTLFAAYTTYNRLWRPQIVLPDMAMKGCLEFYRTELVSEYRSIALIWRFLIPTVIFLFVMWGAIFDRSRLSGRVILSTALILILLMRRLEFRKLKQKLATLDQFESELR